jgi:penicillin-binding protein 1B
VGATLANLRAGYIVEGASTLTQQLAKNLYLSARRTPTRFYARPLVLQPGMAIDPARVERALQRLGYRRVRGRDVEHGEYYRNSSTWRIGRRAFRHYDRLDPGGVATVRMDRRGRVRELRDERGDRVPYVALEPELLRSAYGTLHEERSPVPLDDVPQHLVEAILTIEAWEPHSRTSAPATSWRAPVP